jgi:hypothetical protein
MAILGNHGTRKLMPHSLSRLLLQTGLSKHFIAYYALAISAALIPSDPNLPTPFAHHFPDLPRRLHQRYPNAPKH